MGNVQIRRENSEGKTRKHCSTNINATCDIYILCLLCGVRRNTNRDRVLQYIIYYAARDNMCRGYGV